MQLRPPVGEPSEAFQQQAAAAMTAFAARPGFLGGKLARAADDPGAWAFVTEWRSVGAYRRALGGYEVKLAATPLMAHALDQPSAFEVLLSVSPDGAHVARESDRADDADA